MDIRFEKKELFIRRILWHHNLVVDLMSLLELHKDKLPFKLSEWSLVRRAVKHDMDKFDDMIEFEFESVLKNKSIMDKFKIRHHETQSHHIQYHIKNNSFPNNVDICEMVCDWIASSYKNYHKDIDTWYVTLRERIFSPDYQDVIDFIYPEIDKFYAVADLIDSLGIPKDFFINNNPDYDAR
jgi:hypothetical protein